jgi:hypothetical protein
MGDGTHVRLTLREAGKYISAVGFGFNRNGAFTAAVTDRADVVGVPEINDYRGNKEVRLQLKDISFY